MAAISDPGKSIAAIPHHDELREVFLNPPDIGGRYSALTYVGLVPASLIGLSLGDLLGVGARHARALPRSRSRPRTRAWPWASPWVRWPWPHRPAPAATR